MDQNKNEQLTGLLASGHGKPTQLYEHRVQMYQQPQDRSNWNDPSGYHIWLIQRKKLHNTSG